MSNLLIFDALFIGLLMLAPYAGLTNLTRAGQGLLGIAVLNLALAVLIYFGWPVLHGDVSSQSPLTKQDSIERRGDLDLSRQERPSRNFVLGLFGLGIVALAAGL